MLSRFSPPLKPIRRSHTAPRQPFFRRYSRWAYVLLALLSIYLWHSSSIRLLPSRAPVHAPSLIYKNVDWSRYAYSQYATNSAYLCNAVMVFEALQRLGSKADRILFYPQEWDTDIASLDDRDSQLLVKARDWYNVKLMPAEIMKADDDAWNTSYTKFMAWGQDQYDRVLQMDSDITLLKHLEELFLLPKAPGAMLRAYWRLPDERKLTSFFLLLEPSIDVHQQLMVEARPDHRGKTEYDMEILNRFYGDSAMVVPHRQYGLLSGEFRVDEHRNYLGNDFETWDPIKVIKEASLVHFSDWPLPKPWIMWPHTLIGEVMPKCKLREKAGETDCRNKDIWMELYNDFRRRRKEICALLSAPAPEWPPRNNSKEDKQPKDYP
ncbi:hypothetical protein N7G274_008591 [Stereocaulon virgatum]|uniref:Nucleotide-diphospho-sugar transferase n=1 Tax=Stereocaulon virgatum TaxID=373712 RepID=A0ABR3ZZ81_9LECA